MLPATAATFDQGVLPETAATVDQGTIGATRTQATTVDDIPARPAAPVAARAPAPSPAPTKKGWRRGCAWAAGAGALLLGVIILVIIVLLNGLVVESPTPYYEPEPTAVVRQSNPTSRPSNEVSPTNPPASGNPTSNVSAMTLCSDPSGSGACVHAFGVLNGRLSITVKSNDTFSGAIYLEVDGISQYTCDLVSSGSYFCYGPYRDAGEEITIAIHTSSGTKLASGWFIIPPMVTIPDSTEPASTYP